MEAGDELQKRTSALQHNINQKGQNAYYYAHTRQYEVPPDAKVRSGPGLVTGGPPVKLSEEVAAIDTEATRGESIRDYAWVDEDKHVKVYVQLPAGVLHNTEQVTCDIQAFSFHLQVEEASDGTESGPKKRYCCKVEPLNAELLPDKSSFRVNTAKGKVTLTLKKKRDNKWYDLLKK